MRVALMAGTAALVAASFPAGRAWAQAAAGPGPMSAGHPAPSCSDLPAQAVPSVPAPFDAYMRLMCRDPLGQGLQAAEGSRWTVPGGQPIGLVATTMAGGTEPDGTRRFPVSWYTELSPVDLPAAEQRRLKADFRRAIPPRVLDKARIIELRARTSNGEEKLIFIVLPDTGPGTPAALIGLECNGPCFRKDREPLIFAGSPG